MTILNKIKWIAGILLVFAIILTTNLIDRDNFSKLRYSVVTIYEDRIVANDLIFEMSLLIREKEIAVVKSDSTFFLKRNDKINESMQMLIEQFEQTRLTTKEAKIFYGLKDELKTLERLETEFINSEFRKDSDLLKTINGIVRNLHDLSKVQLEEGRKQMAISNKTMETIELFTQVEVIFLIVMAVLGAATNALGNCAIALH